MLKSQNPVFMRSDDERLLSRSRIELLNKIFLHAGEGILIVNQKAEIILANNRCEELFGYSHEELLGKVIEDLVPHQYQKHHVARRDKYLGHPVSRPMGSGLDLEGLKKDGTTFPLEVSLNYMVHEEQTMVVAFITDISTRKKHEKTLEENQKELEEYASNLEEKVKNRTKELEHLNLGLKSQIRERKLAETALKESLKEVTKAEREIQKALEKEKELNEMKSRFISMASHEFRTPLTTILSSANLIGRYEEAADQEKREKHINRIRTSVQNLTNILNDFLSLEKLESGAISCKVKPFYFPELIYELRESMELTLKKNQHLDISIASNLKHITSDPHLIKNILLNLISNAIKYSSEGTKITLSADMNEDHVVSISIKDEGIGIPEEEQKSMFQRFFRAENATNIQGTGLGLNIVKRYLDLLHGAINFKSKERVGSEFIVNFPVEKSNLH